MTLILIDVGGTQTRLTLLSPERRIEKRRVFSSRIDDLSNQIRVFLPKRLKRKDLLINIGLRGVWTRAEKGAWKRKLSRFARSIKVQSDVELAHEIAFGKGPGILLNGGTGSMAFGRSRKGKTARAGGLGPILGDEGSGFWIGKQILKENLIQKRNRLNIRRYLFYPNSISRISNYGFSHLNNPKYRQIVRAAQRHLLSLVKDVKKQLGESGRLPLKLHGGLFRSQKFRRDFLRQLGRAIAV